MKQNWLLHWRWLSSRMLHSECGRCWQTFQMSLLPPSLGWWVRCASISWVRYRRRLDKARLFRCYTYIRYLFHTAAHWWANYDVRWYWLLEGSLPSMQDILGLIKLWLMAANILHSDISSHVYIATSLGYVEWFNS